MSNTDRLVATEPIRLRRMRRDDLEPVVGIERACFPNAWRRRQFLACLRDKAHHVWVAERFGQVVGFVVYKRDGSVVHLMNLAVDPHYRHRRIAEQMVSHLLSESGGSGGELVRLEVRETNLDAQLFYRYLGFKAVAVRRGYYPDTGEDAYEMEFRMSQPAVAP